MTDTHTPGPWTFIARALKQNEHSEPLAFIQTPEGALDIVAPIAMAAAHAANARLIAAAPEMHAALLAIKRRLHFVGMPGEPRRDDGSVDWHKEIALLESALAHVMGLEWHRE